MDWKKVNIKRILATLLVIGFYLYINWGDYFDAYNKKFNEEREKLGILKIPDDWMTKEKGTKTKLWRSEHIDEVKKGRLGKEVLVHNGKVTAERDRIINKAEDKHEELEVTYHFNQNPQFSYRYFEVQENVHTSNRELTKTEFDEIIKKWEVELE